MVLYQAGVDGLETDDLGFSRAMMKRANCVRDNVAEFQTVVFMGGGVNSKTEHSLDAFYDLFTDAGMNKRWNE